MALFDKLKAPGIKEKTNSEKVHRVPEGMWTKCPSCGEVMQTKVLRESHMVCVACSYHFRMNARERIAFLTGGAQFTEYGDELRSSDPLEFTDLKSYSA